jgi:hypothetical protein
MTAKARSIAPPCGLTPERDREAELVSPAAKRNRLMRARRKAGKRCYSFVAVDDQLEELLEQLDFLKEPIGERNLKAVDRAVQELWDWFVREVVRVTRNGMAE